MEMNGGFLVTKIKQLGDRIFEKILSEKNIDAFNGAQGRILYVLWQEDGISIRSLSTKCGLAITSLTTMLERMENQGLISRVQSETDKRKTLLFLTEKAHALKGEYDSVSDEMGSIYYKDFSEEEITWFEECLDRIRKNLEEWQTLCRSEYLRHCRSAAPEVFWYSRIAPPVDCSHLSQNR
jgi:MarR family transcriptional regulator, organic hydroperoxide resistance regulator